MKFLVLALCVCAASAASFGQSGFNGFQPFKSFSQGPAQASAQAFASNNPSYNYKALPASGPFAQPAANVVTAPVFAAKTVASTPVFGSAFNAAKAVASTPVFGSAFNAAKSVESTPVVAPEVTPLTIAKAVVTAPVVAAQAVRNYLTQDSQAQVLRANSEINDNGFNSYYETDNGISAQAEGILRTIGDEKVLVHQGGYKYTLPNGEIFQLTYVADENGYHAESPFLPQAPPVPEAIARALAWTAARTAEGVKKF